MAWIEYDNFKLRQVNGNAIDLDTDTLKLALVTSSYVPNAASHDFFDDVSANEVTGSNYTAGGATLANQLVTLSAGTVTFDNTVDVTFTQHATGFTNARYAILYKSTGSAATSGLIAYADLGTDVGNQSGDLVLEFDSAGILTFA